MVFVLDKHQKPLMPCSEKRARLLLERGRARVHQMAPFTIRLVDRLQDDSVLQDLRVKLDPLLGYEVREYLLDQWGRACVYCGATGVPLQVEHIIPKSQGGSNRISNLTLACAPCNLTKGTQTAAEFGYPDVQVPAREPLKDAAFMNATRWRLYEELQATGLPVEGGSGGRTKQQRTDHLLPKEHYYDALCVGESTPATFMGLPAYIPIWSAKGRGNRQRCRTDPHGFPIRHLSRHKQHHGGFQTGDLVQAVIPRGKYTGTWTGRATVKASGQIRIVTSTGVHPTTSHRHCRALQRGNGWVYTQKPSNQERGQADSSPA